MFQPLKGTDDQGDVKGIPNFWLTALRNHPHLSELITDEDDDALASLKDIQVSYLLDNPGFKLEFFFDENVYFTNNVLTKVYYLQEDEDGDADDLMYDHAEGTVISWKEGKNLAVKIETKKQRHKGMLAIALENNN